MFREAHLPFADQGFLRPAQHIALPGSVNTLGRSTSSAAAPPADEDYLTVMHGGGALF